MPCAIPKKKVCTEVLSLKEGEVATTAEAFLCQSGFSLEGKCSSAMLKTTGTCDGICTYTNNGTEVNSTSACVCGKNTQGESYCNFGNNSTQLNTVMALKKKNLNNINCHTTERFTPCLSQAFETNSTTHNNFDYQKELRDYNNVNLLNNVEFVNQKPSDCILPVLGPYDMNLITPQSKNKCPMYKCETDQKSCASSHNPNNFDSSLINITLSKGVCQSNQTCSLPDESKVYEKETVDSTCLSNTVDKQKFPGEVCEIDGDCINKNCTSKTCQHMDIDEKCSNDEPIDFSKQCGVGAFCNSTSFCNELIKKDAVCTNTFDCQNDLVCFNKTCSMQYGNVKDGVAIDTSFISADFGNRFEYLCESMNFDSLTKKCYTFTYANTTSMTANDDGYVKCDKKNGKECSYETSIDKSYQLACQCGFNMEGQGYCPVDFSSKTKSKFTDLSSKFKTSLNGKCHSLNRYNCDVDSNGYKNYVKSQEDLLTTHLFYKSVDCAKDVLSGKFINFSVVTLLLISLLF